MDSAVITSLCNEFDTCSTTSCTQPTFLFFLIIDNGTTSVRPDTADLEVQRIQGGQRLSPAPSLAITEGDYGEPDKSGKRSTLQGYICLFILFRLIHWFLYASSNTNISHMFVTHQAKGHNELLLSLGICRLSTKLNHIQVGWSCGYPISKLFQTALPFIQNGGIYYLQK